MNQCPCKIRPMFPVNAAEIQCSLGEGHDTEQHTGALRDYARPGSLTEVTWLKGDRRNYTGEWERCPKDASGQACILPAHHNGSHAA